LGGLLNYEIEVNIVCRRLCQCEYFRGDQPLVAHMKSDVECWCVVLGIRRSKRLPCSLSRKRYAVDLKITDGNWVCQAENKEEKESQTYPEAERQRQSNLKDK
jgi:hypothetical protein